MHPEQIALVQRTFEQVRPLSDTAAALFYQRLFELDPTVRPLFKGNIKQQGVMLMSSLGLAVSGLARPESIIPAVTSLGRRHAGYGVQEHHYATVGAALLWTLEQGLGDEFTPEVRDAWAAAYALLADLMKRAVVPA